MTKNMPRMRFIEREDGTLIILQGNARSSKAIRAQKLLPVGSSKEEYVAMVAEVMRLGGLGAGVTKGTSA